MGIKSIGELLQVNSMTIQIFKKIANSITTRSNIFTIYCRAAASQTGSKMRMEAVVDRGQNMQLLYKQQGVVN